MILVSLLSIIIFILIGIIYLFIPIINKTCNNYQLYKKILYNNAKHSIKNGDLVLFNSNTHNLITRTFGNSTFSHIGIIIKINNVLNVLELVKDDFVYPGNNRYSGIIVTPLYDRITYYNGNVSIASLKQKLTNKQITQLHNFINKKYVFTKYQLSSLIMSNNNERFCSEFIAEILNELNISSIPIKQYKIYLQTAIVNLCNNTIYKYPVHIISEHTLLNNIDDEYNTINYC